jgi:TPR repeat protein
LLLRGAQLGDAHAQYNLARCYADGASVGADGESVGADAAQAEYWFGEALARGVAEARLPLALLLLSHQPAEERRPRGLKLLIAAADGGDADAQYELARRLESGVGDAPDLLRALHYYHEAANADHAEALFRLATIFHRGIDLDRAYPERAAPLFRRLAEEHAHGYAAQILGVMHAQGNGVPRDLPRAERLFELASRLGQNDALLNLALLRAGPSEHHDLVEAAKWAILFDGCAASEESHELMRTLFELLDDDRIVEAEKRAQSWSAESEAHRDVVTVTMARGGVVPANAGTQSIREQSIIAGPRLSPG